MVMTTEGFSVSSYGEVHAYYFEKRANADFRMEDWQGNCRILYNADYKELDRSTLKVRTLGVIREASEIHKKHFGK